jgi:hypothetical protein
MKTFAIYRKAGIRLAILTFLGIVLMIVAKPAKALAFTCQSDCIAAYHVCETGCNGIAACKLTCFNQINSCMQTCSN